MRRSSRLNVRNLTDEELMNAMLSNVNDDEANDDADANSDGEEMDEFTDSEEDFVPDERDENESEEGEEEEGAETQSVSSNNVYVARDGTEWNAAPVDQSTHRYHNIEIEPKIMLPPGKRLDTVLDCFRLIFDEKVIDVIIRYTNIEARRHTQDWKDVDADEMMAYIGLLIIAGVDRSGKRNYNEFFNRLRGLPLFRATMSRDRFKSLLKFIRFDDKDTRSVRRSHDKLAPIRDVFEMVNNNLGKRFSPGKTVTIDEQLVPFRGRCSFKQYMPSKPDKYGIKLFWICDSKTSYPLKAIPYLGRERTGSAPSVGVASDIVKQLCEPYYRTHRIVTFDNFFTNYDLANHLKHNGLLCVGTLRKNKRFIPKEFLANRQRQESSNLFGFRQNATLLSHVPKKNKAVLFLSTFHYNAKVNENGKAEINLFYNETKGGIDTLDQLCHAYTVQRRTNRWPNAFFMNLINVGTIAAFIIYQISFEVQEKRKQSIRKKFLNDLTDELTYNHIRKRSHIGLKRFDQSIIEQVIGPSASDEAGPSNKPRKKAARRRCYLCPSKIDRKVKQCCERCDKNVCNEHGVTVLLCVACHKNTNSSDSQ